MHVHLDAVAHIPTHARSLLEGKTNVVLEGGEVPYTDYEHTFTIPDSLPTAKYWIALLQGDSYNVAAYAPYDSSVAISERGFHVVREGCQTHDVRAG